jgi:hypothetical protein
MKNPWMSAYLSAANKMTAAGRGQMAAEMARQQNAMTKAWTEAATKSTTAMMTPWLGKAGKRGK